MLPASPESIIKVFFKFGDSFAEFVYKMLP